MFVIDGNPHLERIKGFNLNPPPTPTPSRIPIGSSRHGAESAWSLAGSGESHNCWTACTLLSVDMALLKYLQREGPMLKWGTLSNKETEQVNERERQTLEEAKVDKKRSAPLVPTLAIIVKSTFCGVISYHQ